MEARQLDRLVILLKEGATMFTMQIKEYYTYIFISPISQSLSHEIALPLLIDTIMPCPTL